MNATIAISKAEITELYEALRDRVINPDGTFDNGGRWYPSAAEDCGVSSTVRSPSKAWPFSYMTACRTLKHVKALADQSPDLFARQLAAARAANGNN